MGKVMNIVAIIQARMGSTRLPAKIMKKISGRTVLDHVLARVRACPRLQGVVVATTTAPADDAVMAETVKQGAGCFRGSESDVLSRYCLAARENRAEVVVRITSDCPLYDPELLTDMLDEFQAKGAAGGPVDYLSNTLVRTFPRGLDTEIFTGQALERAHQEARQPFEREHVTPYFYQNPQKFALHSFRQTADLSGYRWTLDTPDDLRFVEAVYAALYSNGRRFTTREVLDLLKRQPELAAINAHVEQKKLADQP
jgi:spore coat polysaccharide biosynthesis protein SpsF